MAVDKDLLQLDLYGLLGVGEKASEKEVSAVGRLGARPPPSLSRPGRPRPCSAAPRLALGGREGARGWVRARGCSPPPLTAAPSARLVPGFFLKRAPSSWFLLPRLCTLRSKVPPVFARNPVARGRSRRCRLLEVISLVLRVWNYMVMLFC